VFEGAACDAGADEETPELVRHARRDDAKQHDSSRERTRISSLSPPRTSRL
jgi:hypothetical protein